MKIDQDYELFVRDLVLRLTSNPNFNPTNGEVEKACQHAFRVSEIFFARWEVEKARVSEALAKLPETWGGPQNSPNDEGLAKGGGKTKVKASNVPKSTPKEKRGAKKH
jgi:hypothetical protein